MHEIAALVSGIRGAENGSASIYKRGTTTRAALYSDFEATSVLPSADVSLDANGSAVVYVNELVNVIVKDSSGNVVRQFVPSPTSGAVEVISSGFTGSDYETAESGTSLPTTLTEVLNSWLTSAGAPDFNVLVPAGQTTIQAALSGSALYYNVKSNTYGAVGDGAVDDTSAIQAAINAANAAGGGVVFFPKGTYRVTAALTLPGSVHLLGTSAATSILRIDHATAKLLVTSGTPTTFWQTVALLTLTAAQANSGNIVDCSSSDFFLLRECFIGGANCDGDLVLAGASNFLKLDGCTLSPGSASASAVRAQNAILVAIGNYFIPNAAYSPANGMVDSVSAVVDIVGNVFDNTFATSGTYSVIKANNPDGMIVGNHFTGSGGATVTAMALGAFNSSTVFVEHSNHLEPGITNYTLTGADQAKALLGSRVGRWTSQSISGAGTLALDDKQAETIIVDISTNGAITFTSTPPHNGATLCLVLDNNFAGATGNLTFGTGFRGLAPITVANAKVRVLRWTAAATAGTLEWLFHSNSGDI